MHLIIELTNKFILQVRLLERDIEGAKGVTQNNSVQIEQSLDELKTLSHHMSAVDLEISLRMKSRLNHYTQICASKFLSPAQCSY